MIVNALNLTKIKAFSFCHCQIIFVKFAVLTYMNTINT